MSSVQCSHSPGPPTSPPSSPEWDALAVLLARGDFGIADRWALLRTCKTFSRLVLSSARAIHVTLDEAGRFHSPYTAQLLSDIIGSTRTEAASEAGGPEVQLTLRTTPSHSLPKASITTLILQDVVLMLSELNDYLVQLSEHTRLKTLRIQGLTWAPDFGGGASSTEHDALQITAESLKIEDSPTALPWGSASCALKGALVNCTSLAVPVWISLCFLQEQDAFTDCLQSIHITVDHAQSLGSCVELLTKLPSLKNVHLDFPSFSVAGKVRLCEPSGPHTPWQSLTLSGYVPYKILSKLPLHETTKVSIKSQAGILQKAFLQDVRSFTTTPAKVQLAPTGGAPCSLRAAGCGETRTLHLYSPDAETLGMLLPRLSPDVECLTILCEGGTALLSDAVTTLSHTLPTHVHTLAFQLNSTTTGQVSILPHYPCTHNQIPASVAHTVGHNQDMAGHENEEAARQEIQHVLHQLTFRHRGYALMLHTLHTQHERLSLMQAMNAHIDGLAAEWVMGGVQVEGAPEVVLPSGFENQSAQQLCEEMDSVYATAHGAVQYTWKFVQDPPLELPAMQQAASHMHGLFLTMLVRVLLPQPNPAPHVPESQAACVQSVVNSNQMVLALALPAVWRAVQAVRSEMRTLQNGREALRHTLREFDGGAYQDAPLPANMEHIMQALEAANREQRAQAQQAQASHVHIPEGAFECKPLLHMLPRHVKTVCVEVVNTWQPGDERTKHWLPLLHQVAWKHETPQPIRLIVANLQPETGYGSDTPSPSWLQGEKDAILKWRDEHTGSDGNVTVCFA